MISCDPEIWNDDMVWRKQGLCISKQGTRKIRDMDFDEEINLSAAFDTIDHTILLNRLTSSFGIMVSSHNLLKSYKVPIIFYSDSYIDFSGPELALHCWQLVRKTCRYMERHLRQPYIY